MTSSKLCTVALFMKDTGDEKNYCKTKVEPNSILSRRYHIINVLWFIVTQNTLTVTVVCPQKQKETHVNPPLGIIKLNMSCSATSSYLTLLPYYHNESKWVIQDQFIDDLKLHNGSYLQIWKPFLSTVLNFPPPKTDIPAVLKDTKEIPMRHLILTAYNSRKSGQFSVPRWIYQMTMIPTLTILGVGIIAVYYKCKKRSAKIYRLARNRGKTMETPEYNAVPVCTGDKDDVYMEKIIPHSMKKIQLSLQV